MNTRGKFSKTVILKPSRGTLIITYSDDIIRCEKSRTQVLFHLKSRPNDPVAVTATLKEWAEELYEAKFVITEQSHLVNLHEVMRYHYPSDPKKSGGDVTMSDGSRVPVARDGPAEFLKELRNRDRVSTPRAASKAPQVNKKKKKKNRKKPKKK